MLQFLAALAVFLALHSVPAIPAIRQTLVARFGRKTYLVLYSIASLAALFWVFHAALALDYVELWQPSAWQAWFPLILTPIAFFLLIAGLASPNPASVTLRRNQGRPGAIVTMTRHPVLWGFLLWAIGHLVANGDLRSLLLFGTFAAFSIFGMMMAERRSARNNDPALHALKNSTSIVPFAAVATGRSKLRMDRAIAIALLLAIGLTGWLLLGGHAALFGADPLAMTQI